MNDKENRKLNSLDRFRGIMAGLIGGLIYGLYMTAYQSPSHLIHAIPALYGLQGPNVAMGWLIHLIHSALMGLVYAETIDSLAPLRFVEPRSIKGGIIHGVNCGFMIGVVFGITIMPLWLQFVGYSDPLPFLDLRQEETYLIVAGHTIYGFFMGVTYGFVQGNK